MLSSLMPNHRSGFVALLSLIMVAAIAASAIMILFTTSITSLQNTGDTEKGRAARVMADSCAEIALLNLSQGTTLTTPYTMTGFAKGSCTVQTIVNTSGNNWTIEVTSTVSETTGSITKYVEVEAVRETDSAAQVRSWQEVVSF